MRAKIEASQIQLLSVSSVIELDDRSMKNEFFKSERIVMIRTKGREYFARQYVKNRENARAMEI